MGAGLDVDSAEECARECAAARVALLAVTLHTALSVQSLADKDAKIKPLLSAAWRVSHELTCRRHLAVQLVLWQMSASTSLIQ